LPKVNNDNSKNGTADMRLKKRQHIHYLAPSMIIISLLFILPILFLIIISFTNYRLGYTIEKISFLGLGNFLRLFNGTDQSFYNSVFLSIAFTILGTALQLVFGMISALLLNQEFKFKGIVIACLVIPIALTPSISSQIWKLMFSTEFGIINYFLNLLFGIKIAWLDMNYAFLSVLIATVWQFTPFVTLMLYAGLRTLPDTPYESAAIDGANKFQQFFHITLPLMRKLIILCALLRSIDLLKTFDIPYVLTQGGPGSATKFLGLLIFDMGFGESNFVARACAIAVVLIIIVSLLSLIMIYIMKRIREE
jgi:multiple sugar transport system permease protein